MTLAERCRWVNALILDVDGVLTCGAIIYQASGQEIKQFHVRDGSAIKLWQRAGKSLAVLSGRTSEVTWIRAKELGIQHVFQGNADKHPGYDALLGQMHVKPSAVAYVGDDLADVPLMHKSVLAIAPADACSEAIRAAHYVTRLPGGWGAVREVIDLILRAQDLWQGD